MIEDDATTRPEPVTAPVWENVMVVDELTEPVPEIVADEANDSVEEAAIDPAPTIAPVCEKTRVEDELMDPEPVIRPV